VAAAPGLPIWGLKLAQLWASRWFWGESAAVAREILATAETGRHPNYQPVAAAMARVLLAEALLGDLRVEEACATVRDAGSGGPAAAEWVGSRAERVRARCLDLERRADSPEGRAVALLARSRRLRERGDEAEAEATASWPSRPPGERRGAPVRGAGEPAPRAGRTRRARSPALLDGRDAAPRPFAPS
jgi:hypothetical protein